MVRELATEGRWNFNAHQSTDLLVVLEGITVAGVEAGDDHCLSSEVAVYDKLETEWVAVP